MSGELSINKERVHKGISFSILVCDRTPPPGYSKKMAETNGNKECDKEYVALNIRVLFRKRAPNYF